MKDIEEKNQNNISYAFDICCHLLPLLQSDFKRKDDCRRVLAALYALTDFNAIVLRSDKKIITHFGDTNVLSSPNMSYPSIRTVLSGQINTQLELIFYKKIGQSITDDEKQLTAGIAKFIESHLKANMDNYQSMLRAKTELKTLQAQINPHFLFNALNTISSLCRTEPLKARRLILHLASYLRSTIRTSPDLVDIHKELDSISSYMEIEKARFGDNFKVEIDVDKNIRMPIPPFTIQPIVENSIKHGLVDKKDGLIKISVKKQNNFFKIIISDNGCGMPEQEIQKVLKNNQSQDKIGLSNVNNRLKEIYGIQYGLDIQSEIDKGTSVIIKIPIRKRRKADAVKSSYSG
ncbi:MAG: histidine kinase [Clostridia bacterium]|nr:histidine kinase [Clostridia bacterium]